MRKETLSSNRKREAAEKQLIKLKTDLEAKKQEVKELQSHLADIEKEFQDHKRECARKILDLEESLMLAREEADSTKSEANGAKEGGVLELAALRDNVAELKAALEAKSLQASQQVQGADEKLAV